jgi:hypothetical protein
VKEKVNNLILYNLKFGMTDYILSRGLLNPKMAFDKKVVSSAFHYTSLETLRLIIENQSLFFSNQLFLNDRIEFWHGVEIVQKSCEKFGPDNKISSVVKKKIKDLPKESDYIFCLTKDGDLLSQ